MTPGEKRTVLAVLRDLRAAGYAPVAVWDGEAYNWPNAEGNIETTYDRTGLPDAIDIDLTDDQALELVDGLDECTLHFTHQNKRTWGNRGVFFVMGNDPEGTEVLADHHCPDGEDFTRILNELTDRLIEGGAP